MALLDLQKLTVGLSRMWAGFLRDWDRSLRSGNYPETTRYNYLLAAAQLARYLGEHSLDPDADDGAANPCVVTKAHVEAFQAWMVETRSTAVPTEFEERNTCGSLAGSDRNGAGVRCPSQARRGDSRLSRDRGAVR
jgi:hypothetical protein